MDYSKRISRHVRVLSVICLLAVAHASANPRTLIRGIVPIDPMVGTLPRQDVLIEDGVIAAMGELNAADPEATIIDGRGTYLLPGLWDMHVHLTYDPRLTPVMARLFLDHGITSVRDTGAPLDTLFPVLETYRSLGPQAPRMFFAGPLLDGIPTVYDGENTRGIGSGTAQPEEAARRVKVLAEAGVDFIKIYEMVTPEVFAALVAEANKHQLPIAAHVPLSMLASDAAPQVQSLEHLRNLELDCAANADALLAVRIKALRNPDSLSGMDLRSALHGAQRDKAIDNEDPARCARVLETLSDTIQVPTLRLNAMTQHPPFEADGWDEALELLPATVQKEWKRAPEFMDPRTYRRSGAWSLAMIPRLLAAGVPIGAGTDTPIGWAVPGHSLHQELQLLNQAGLSPLATIQAATVVPARFFGRQQTMGRIKPGYDADLLLLRENPLESLDNLKSIEGVFREGIRVR